MIRGKRPHQGGYTIIEVITVLTISTVLIVSAMALFNSRIPRTQFSQAVTELETKLRGVTNDVQNGFYPSTNNIKCDATSGVQAAPGEQGTNSDCIFMGKAIQFASQKGDCDLNSPPVDHADCDQIGIYTVWGLRKDLSTTQNNTELAEPKIIDPTTVGAGETYTIPHGLHITKIIGPVANPNGVAYLQTFGSGAVTVDGGEERVTGSQSVEMRVFNTNSGNLALGQPASVFAGFTNIKAASKNPANGVIICLKSGTTDQLAAITLGENNNPMSVTQRILSAAEWGVGGAGC